VIGILAGVGLVIGLAFLVAPVASLFARGASVRFS
jgi:hypothetical protein